MEHGTGNFVEENTSIIFPIQQTHRNINTNTYIHTQGTRNVVEDNTSIIFPTKQTHIIQTHTHTSNTKFGQGKHKHINSN